MNVEVLNLIPHEYKKYTFTGTICERCTVRIRLISQFSACNIDGRDVQRKNVVNNVDKSSLWAP